MPSDIQKIIQDIKNHPIFSPKFCDSCGHLHEASDVQVVSQQQGNIAFQISCQQCGLMQMLKLSPGAPLAIQRFETNNSDVKGKEFQKFAGKSAIDKDEALDVYEKMQKVETVKDFLEQIDRSNQA